MYNGIIPYDSLTYGQLANFVSQEALNFCSLIKVNAIIKKDFKYARKELGLFCVQYGYDIPLPPSVRQEKLRTNKKYSKFKEEPFYRKLKHKKHKKYQNFPAKKNDEKYIKCIKCGKNGHIAPNCKIK